MIRVLSGDLFAGKPTKLPVLSEMGVDQLPVRDVNHPYHPDQNMQNRMLG